MSPCNKQFHQFLPSNFSRVIYRVFLSPYDSITQVESSAFTFLCHLPSTIASFGLDLSDTLKSEIPILTFNNFAVVPAGSLMCAVTSSKVYYHVYFSVYPPFPAFGYCLTFSSSLFSPSSFSFFSFFGLFLASYCFLCKFCNSSIFFASSSSISSMVAPYDSVITYFD